MREADGDEVPFSAFCTFTCAVFITVSRKSTLGSADLSRERARTEEAKTAGFTYSRDTLFVTLREGDTPNACCEIIELASAQLIPVVCSAL